MIRIKKYDNKWAKDFLALKEKLESILGSLAISIDHIGSTAVPHLGAKDVIDIQVTVDALTPEIKERFEAAGCPFNNAASDHVPLGADPSPHHWQKFLFSEPPGWRRANIHVRVSGCLNQRYALLFRDYLKAHPRAVPTVELIKTRISALTEDIEAYLSIKDPVYDLLLIGAEEWAKATGWHNGYTQ